MEKWKIFWNQFVYNSNGCGNIYIFVCLVNNSLSIKNIVEVESRSENRKIIINLGIWMFLVKKRKKAGVPICILTLKKKHIAFT